MLVFESSAIVASLEPDLAAIGKAREARGVIVTAMGSVAAARGGIHCTSTMTYMEGRLFV